MLPDNHSIHRMCRLEWNGVGQADGTGWEKVIFPTETCLHVNTVSEEDIPMGMTHLMSGSLSSFGERPVTFSNSAQKC